MFAKVKEYCLLAEARFKISLRVCRSEAGKAVIHAPEKPAFVPLFTTRTNKLQIKSLYL